MRHAANTVEVDYQVCVHCQRGDVTSLAEVVDDDDGGDGRDHLWRGSGVKWASFVSKECGTGQPEFVTSGDDGALPGVVRSDGHACEHFRQQHP